MARGAAGRVETVSPTSGRGHRYPGDSLLPLARTGFVYKDAASTATVTGMSFDREFVDGLHAQIGECHDAGAA